MYDYFTCIAIMIMVMCKEWVIIGVQYFVTTEKVIVEVVCVR